MGFLPFLLAFDHTKIFHLQLPEEKSISRRTSQKIHKRRTSKGGVYEKLSSWHGYSEKHFFHLLFGFLRFVFCSSPHCPLQLRQTSCFIIEKLLLVREDKQTIVGLLVKNEGTFYTTFVLVKSTMKCVLCGFQSFYSS